MHKTTRNLFASLTATIVVLAASAAYFSATHAHPTESWLFIVLGIASASTMAITQLTRLRQEQRREEMLHAIFDAVPNILFFKDAAGRYREINHVFMQTFGISAAQAYGKTDEDLFGRMLHDRFSEQDRRLMATGESGTFHESMVIGEKEVRIESRKRPIFDSRGRALGVVGLAIDVTEQTALREQLKNSNARLGIALSAARMGTWAWDLSTDVIEADPHVRELLGLEAGQITASVVFDKMHPDDVGEVTSRIERIIDTREALSFEFRLGNRESDSVRWIEGSAALHQHPDGTPYLIGINHDITERKARKFELMEARKRAEAALVSLQESRANLDLALETGQLGVWHWEVDVPADADFDPDADLDGNLQVDASILRIFGRDPSAQMTRTEVRDAIHWEDRDRVLESLRSISVPGHNTTYADHYRIVRPNGDIRSIAIRASSRWHKRHETESWRHVTIGIVRDTTEEEQLKQDLMEMAKEAVKATEAKSEFLAMMSHEIRTPMTGVIGMIDHLSDTDMDAEQKHMLHVCKASADSLLTLLNDILDFSKISAGKLDLENEAFSLWEVVESVTESFLPLANAKGLRLGLEVTTDAPDWVCGDAVRIRQICANLLNNAIKFTSEGQVTVRLTQARDDRVQSKIRLEIADTGIGMDEATLKNLFQPFSQADAATTRKFGGTGLGLSIVKRLVGLMHGTLDCSSEVGNGTIFAVVLPLAVVESAAPAHPGPLSGMRIIVLAQTSRHDWILHRFLPIQGAQVMRVSAPSALCDVLSPSSCADHKNVLLIDGSLTPELDSEIRSYLDLFLTVVLIDSEPACIRADLLPLRLQVPLTRPVLLDALLSLAPTPAGTSRTAPVDSVQHSSARILLAEDSPVVKEVLLGQLRKLGYESDCVSSGEEAWQAIQHDHVRYAVLLTDCSMPGMDGYELARRVRQLEADSGSPAIPIIALTANALPGERTRCLAAGMTDYLSKPVRQEALSAALANVLSVGSPPMGAVLKHLNTVFGGSSDKIADVLELFCQTSSEDLSSLVHAYKKSSSDSVRKIAHKIRSACRQLGEYRAADAFAAIELAPPLPLPSPELQALLDNGRTLLEADIADARRQANILRTGGK